MGPVVSQLEREFGAQVAFRRYVLDRLVPGTADHQLAFDLARQVAMDRTPTYLIAGRDGRLRARLTGATSYLTLRGTLTEALKPAP